MKYPFESKSWVDVKFDQSKRYVHVFVEGQIDFRELRTLFDKIVSSKDYKTGMGRIWNFSVTDLSEMDAESVKKMADVVEESQKGRPPTKVALVTTKSINLPICRLFKLHSIEAGSIVEVFEQFEDAERWILSQ